MVTEEWIDELRVSRPAPLLWALEPWRAPYEMMALWMSMPALAAGRRGDGHAVLVLPGLFAADWSTMTLRWAMSRRGLHAAGWSLGPDIGPTPVIVEGIASRIRELHRQTGQTVSLVGWSLGGLLAREAARHLPELVRDVVTLGSPFRLRVGHESLTYAGLLYRLVSPAHAHVFAHLPAESDRAALPCPSTSIFSRTDGVVPWAACVEMPGALRESIEVTSSHLGYGVNPAVLTIVLDRLTQPDGRWAPYRGGAGKATVDIGRSGVEDLGAAISKAAR